MKKSFLLLIAGSIAMNVSAQERQMSIVNQTNVPVPIVKKGNAPALKSQPVFGNAAHKTTTGGDRWYNYGDYLDTLAAFNLNYIAGSDPVSVGSEAEYLWNDTLSQDAFDGGTTSHNTNVSLGTILDPTWKGFNDPRYYPPGLMTVKPTDLYVVDSVIVVGAYGINPARIAAGVVDTLIVSVVHGNGGAPGASDVYNDMGLSGTHWGSPTWMDLHYDSTGLNMADGYYSTHSYMRIPMLPGILSGADTLGPTSFVMYSEDNGNMVQLGTYYKRIALPTPISCAAHDMVGISVSFKSGDPTFAANDVVFASDGTYNFNMLRPTVEYLGTPATAAGLGTPEWPILNVGDNNVGLFKTLPDTARGWGHQYIPTWAWTTASGTAAASSQYPYIWTHITCATCAGVIPSITSLGVNNISIANSIDAYPNPATGELNIAFSLTQSANVAVSLTNMVGQVVATQQINNVTTGKAVFNTTTLPEGIYIYNVTANGERSTGRVVIAH